MKNDSSVQSLNELAAEGRDDSGSDLRPVARRCFTNTEVTVTESFTNALLAFNQGRADALMWDDTVLVGVAAADQSTRS